MAAGWVQGLFDKGNVVDSGEARRRGGIVNAGRVGNTRRKAEGPVLIEGIHDAFAVVVVVHAPPPPD